MGNDCIFARETVSVVGAGVRLVRTPETVLVPVMIIPVPLDLLAVCVPVEAVPHPAEDNFLATEVGICLGFVGVCIRGFILNAVSGTGWGGTQGKETCVSRAVARDECSRNQCIPWACSFCQYSRNWTRGKLQHLEVWIACLERTDITTELRHCGESRDVNERSCG